MNMFLNLHRFLAQSTAEIWGIDAPSFTLEPPNHEDYGDLATNLAMVLAKPLKLSPRAIAQQLITALLQHPDIQSAEIANPSFINIKLHPKVWQQQITNILQQQSHYGASEIGAGAVVHIEFVSCNPTGPMHFGHVRGAVFGDVLARALEKTGFKVVREFYINDAGSQIATLLRSVHVRYLQLLGVDIAIPDGCYPGDYLISIARNIYNQHGNSLQNISEEQFNIINRERVLDDIMQIIKSDLQLLGVRHDIFISEQHDIHNSTQLQKTLDFLASRSLSYEGILPPPKGKAQEDWQPLMQVIFRATDFGDDVDRPLIKHNGEFTYFAGDAAYHHHKIARGFNNMILVLGADHAGYVKRIQSIVKALSDGQAKIDVKVTQLVNLLQDGKPYKMSKRAGNFITAADMVDELGTDVIRFMMLTRKADTMLDLDISALHQQSKENPVFYVQYAHARANSILCKAAENGVQFAAADLSLLLHPAELSLIKKIAYWPQALSTAALLHEPHRIAYYLQELATLFHSVWAIGNDDHSMRFFYEDNQRLTEARIALALAVKYTIASGLEVLGITAVDSM